MTRGSSLMTAVVAVAAGAVGLLGAVALRDHLPDSLKESPTKTGLAVIGAGVAGGALLSYLGYPTAAIATAASLGGAGAFELASPLISGNKDAKPATQPSKGAPGGGIMPTVGPVSPMPGQAGTLLGQAQNALGSAINTIAGWANGQPSQGGGAPTYPQLPNGYQDPWGAAQGIATTIAQHTDYGNGGGGAQPASYPLPGDVLPPSQWPVNRVVRRPINRVVRVGCVDARGIGRVVMRPRAA